MIKKNKFLLGFTLIELLVVISILGILAGAILVAVNPLEQLSKGRDAGRKTTVNQLGRAVESYYTSQNGTYPNSGNTWMSVGLKEAGELKSVPSAITPACGNSSFAENGYCYEINPSGTEAIIYVPGESKAERIRAGCTSTQKVWIVWSSAAGKTGSTCTSSEANNYPSVGITDLK